MISYEVTSQELAISTYIISILGNPSFLCLLGSRMFFSLMEAAELGVNEGTSHRAHDHDGRIVSDIQFAEFGDAPDNADNEH